MVECLYPTSCIFSIKKQTDEKQIQPQTMGHFYDKFHPHFKFTHEMLVTAIVVRGASYDNCYDKTST